MEPNPAAKRNLCPDSMDFPWTGTPAKRNVDQHGGRPITGKTTSEPLLICPPSEAACATYQENRPLRFSRLRLYLFSAIQKSRRSWSRNATGTNPRRVRSQILGRPRLGQHLAHLWLQKSNSTRPFTHVEGAPSAHEPSGSHGRENFTRMDAFDVNEGGGGTQRAPASAFFTVRLSGVGHDAF